MTRQDPIWKQHLDDIQEITPTDYAHALCYSQESVIMYSSSCSARIVDINEEQLRRFIENILMNNECHVDYVIEDFGGKTGIATILHENGYIYYTMYDDVFSNPFDFVKIKVDNIILDRLRNISNYN